METSHYYVPLRNWRALGDILLSVLDPRLAPVWIVALLIGPVISRSSADGSRRVVAVFALMAALNVVLYWVCIPYRTQQRFMLQALGLAVVPLAATLDRSRWLRYGAALLLILHLLTPQGWPFILPDGSVPWDLTPLIPNTLSDPMLLFVRIGRASLADASKRSALGLAVLVGIILCSLVMVAASRRGSVRSPRSPVRWTVIVLSSLSFIGLGFVDVGGDLIDPRTRFYPAFADFFAGWLQLEYRSGPAGSRVAYAGTNIPYYLMASGLRNDVRYVNIDGHRDWLMHDYHREAMRHGQGTWPNSRPGWDRIAPDFQAWVDNLDAEGIQLLVVTRVNVSEGPHNVADADYFPIERQWAESHPESFELLYGQRENDPWFRLYRFRRGRSARSPESDRAAGAQTHALITRCFQKNCRSRTDLVVRWHSYR